MKTAIFIVGQFRSLIFPEMQTKLEEALSFFRGDVFFVIEEPQPKVNLERYNPREILYYKYRGKVLNPGRPAYLMAYGWKQCMKLIRKHEERDRKAYDLIYKTRPDLLLLNRIPKELSIPDEDLKDSIMYGETLGGYNTTKGTPGEAIKDTFNIITRPACETVLEGFFDSFLDYNNFYAKCEAQPNEAKLGFFLSKNNVKKRLLKIKRVLVKTRPIGDITKLPTTNELTVQHEDF